MNNLANIVKVEIYKILSSKAFWIVVGLVLVVQPFMAWVNAKDILRLGLDATPASHPELAQAFPPKEYLGFYDMVAFGLLPMVVLGGILGASEYRNHQLRTTLLYCNSRIIVYYAKTISLIICIVIVSFISIYTTISITQFGLGSVGLHPLILSSITWTFIGYSVLEWMLLTILSYLIGSMCCNVVVPLVFLIPQIYGLAPYLASKWSWGEYLPVTAGNLITSTPTDILPHDPVLGGFILGIWVIVALLIAIYLFVHKDVGGIY